MEPPSGFPRSDTEWAGSHRTAWDFSLCPHVLTWPLPPVLEAVNMLVNRPDLREPVRLELADLLTKDPEKFNRDAEEFTLKYGEDRPS